MIYKPAWSLADQCICLEMLAWADGLRRRAWESGLTCAACATVIFSLSALQVKLTGGRVPVLELCVIRSSISLCTSLSLGKASKIKPLFGHRRTLPLLVLRGLFGTAAIACSYAALLNLPLGDAVTLAQLRPPVMAVMGYLLLHEPLGWLGAAGCLISLVGATIVSHPPFLFGGHSQWGQQRMLGTLCGIASPCFGAGTGYCIRRIQKQEPALVVALYFHICTVGLLVWPLLAGWPQAAVMVSARDAALLLGISCTSFSAQLLMTRAFQLLHAAHASSLNFLGVVYSHALGALVFGEQLTLFTLAGGVLIFAGVLLVAVRTRTPDNSSSSSSGKAAAGATSSSSSTASMQSAEDDASVPLKAFDYHPQQQQQEQAGGPDTATRGTDQARKLTAAAATIPADVELGVRQQMQEPGSSSDADGIDTQQEQQQSLLLRPLLTERPSGSSSFSGSFTSAGSLLPGR